MEKKEILTKYGQNYDAIIRIGQYPLSQELQLSNLGDIKEMKATTQRCYNDMKKEDLDISVIDYLCRISTLFLISRIKAKIQIDYAMKIVDGYWENVEETKNLLRYFMKDPLFLLNEIKTDVFDHLKSFYIIGGLWFTLRELENLESIYAGSSSKEKMIKEFWKSRAHIFSTNKPQ